MRVYHHEFTTFVGICLIRLSKPDSQLLLWPSDWLKRHSTRFWSKYLGVCQNLSSFSQELYPHLGPYPHVAPKISKNLELSNTISAETKHRAIQSTQLGVDFRGELQQNHVIAIFCRRATQTNKNIGITVKPTAAKHKNGHT